MTIAQILTSAIGLNEKESVLESYYQKALGTAQEGPKFDFVAQGSFRLNAVCRGQLYFHRGIKFPISLLQFNSPSVHLILVASTSGRQKLSSKYSL